MSYSVILNRLFVVFRGILSAEWLANNKKCKGLPLYIPDLIKYSRLLDSKEKMILMTLLTTKLRNGQSDIDCDDARNAVIRAKELINIVNGILSRENQKKQENGKNSIHEKVCELRNEMNIEKGSSNAKILEQLVFNVIESFK